jgi:hypothetical protein
VWPAQRRRCRCCAGRHRNSIEAAPKWHKRARLHTLWPTDALEPAGRERPASRTLLNKLGSPDSKRAYEFAIKSLRGVVLLGTDIGVQQNGRAALLPGNTSLENTSLTTRAAAHQSGPGRGAPVALESPIPTYSAPNSRRHRARERVKRITARKLAGRRSESELARLKERANACRGAACAVARLLDLSGSISPSTGAPPYRRRTPS